MGGLRLVLAGAMAALVVPAGASAQQWIYTADLEPPGAISGYSTRSIGPPAPILGSPFAAGEVPLTGIAIAPDGGEAVSVSADGELFRHAIGADGALAPLDGSPAQAGGAGSAVAFSPGGGFVYVADSGAAVIRAFARGTELIELPGSPFAAPSAPRALAFSSDGEHLYAAGGNGLDAYEVMTDGALTPMAGSSGGTDMDATAVTLTPNGRYLYVADRATGLIRRHTISGSGAVARLSGTRPAGADASALTTTPDGRSLYVASRGDSTVSAFHIGGDGGLTKLPGSPYSLPRPPGALAANSAGTRLHAVTDAGAPGRLITLAIGPDGELDLASLSSVAAAGPGGPGSIALTPSQPPVAAFATSGHRMVRLDASASRDPDGAIARYEWDFGDDIRLDSTASAVSHRFTPGIYTVRLTVVDESGCSTAYVSSGQTPFCNGSAVATASRVLDLRPPALSLRARSRVAVRRLAVRATCGERCALEATGKLVLDRKRFPLRHTAEAELAGRGSATLQLPLGPRARRLSRRAGSAHARVTVAATDVDGVRARRSVRIRLR